MSRSGYDDECDDNLQYGRWRAQVASTIRGKTGQAFLRELVEALETMPVKRLVVNELYAYGEVCALGAVAVKRGLDVREVDPDDIDTVASLFGITHQLACEIVYLNDEANWINATPETRWQGMLDWAKRNIKVDK